MQFLEVSDLGIRAAIYRLQRSGCATEFVLFPMLPVGLREYYAKVKRRLANCDHILFEGVTMRATGLLGLAFHSMALARSDDLVTQDALDLSGLRSKLVHADVTGEEFEQGWQTVSLGTHLLLAGLAPAMSAYTILFGAKEPIASLGSLDDLPSREEIFSRSSASDELDELVVTRRDRRLLERIDEVLQATGSAATHRTIAVLFGAAHMRAVMGYLTQDLHYHTVGAEWVTIYEF